jgi:hypothetical protein
MLREIAVGLDPRFIEVFLENYHEFNNNRDVESAYILWDIGVAVWNAPLTSQERSVIQRLYLSQPQSPARTDKVGRPAGGTTLASIGEKSTVSNLKRSAIEKIAQFLGDEYGLE